MEAVRGKAILCLMNDTLAPHKTLVKPETAKMLRELEYELFESEEHASTRAILNASPQNDGGLEDIDTVLNRIDEYTPSMQQLVNHFLKISVAQ